MGIRSVQIDEQWIGTPKVLSIQNADMSTKDIVKREWGRWESMPVLMGIEEEFCEIWRWVGALDGLLWARRIIPLIVTSGVYKAWSMRDSHNEQSKC